MSRKIEVEEYELEKIQSLLVAIWNLEDKHNDDFSGSVKVIVAVIDSKIDKMKGEEHD